MSTFAHFGRLLPVVAGVVLLILVNAQEQTQAGMRTGTGGRGASAHPALVDLEPLSTACVGGLPVNFERIGDSQCNQQH